MSEDNECTHRRSSKERQPVKPARRVVAGTVALQVTIFRPASKAPSLLVQVQDRQKGMLTTGSEPEGREGDQAKVHRACSTSLEYAISLLKCRRPRVGPPQYVFKTPSQPGSRTL